MLILFRAVEAYPVRSYGNGRRISSLEKLKGCYKPSALQPSKMDGFNLHIYPLLGPGGVKGGSEGYSQRMRVFMLESRLGCRLNETIR